MVYIYTTNKKLLDKIRASVAPLGIKACSVDDIENKRNCVLILDYASCAEDITEWATTLTSNISNTQIILLVTKITQGVLELSARLSIEDVIDYETIPETLQHRIKENIAHVEQKTDIVAAQSKKIGELRKDISIQELAFSSEGRLIWYVDDSTKSIVFKSLADMDEGIADNLVSVEFSRPLRKVIDNWLKSTDITIQKEFYSEGSDRIMLLKGKVIRDSQGYYLAAAGTLTDITEQKQREENIQLELNYDLLTGLANRRQLVEKLSHELAMAKRGLSSGSLSFVDLDNFKGINDKYGHFYGDIVLKEIANRIKECIRDYDTAVRLSGDEFVILQPKLSDIEDVKKICERLISHVSRSICLGSDTVKVTISIGVVEYPVHGTTVEDILHYADMAMYEAKKCTKNAYRIFGVGTLADGNSSEEIPSGLNNVIEMKRK